jgi:hypothetical protein
MTDHFLAKSCKIRNLTLGLRVFGFGREDGRRVFITQQKDESNCDTVLSGRRTPTFLLIPNMATLPEHTVAHRRKTHNTEHDRSETYRGVSEGFGGSEWCSSLGGEREQGRINFFNVKW